MKPSATTLTLAALVAAVLATAPAQAQRGVDPGWSGAGAGIVEVEHPAGDPCPDLTVQGCLQYDGNTVWHDENSTDDYYLTAGSDGTLTALERYAEAVEDDHFEIRFTSEGGYAVYGFTDFQIAEVPFELWNVGATPDDPSDDVRMIPFLNANADPLTDWEDAFTGADPWPLAGGTPITDWIYWMMPDREDGYELFEDAAVAFGGAGAIYDPAADGDDQVDPNPVTGADCTNQGAYVDWCYNLDLISDPALQDLEFVYPIGRLAFADLAGDGTTPEEGTVIRLYTSGEPPVVDTDDGPEAPEAFTLLPVSPNPLTSRAKVAFTAPAAGHVRVSVYDLLGREVAVLTDGLQTAGRHEVTLDAGPLASGVYVVVMEAEGAAPATRKVTVLR